MLPALPPSPRRAPQRPDATPRPASPHRAVLCGLALIALTIAGCGEDPPPRRQLVSLAAELAFAEVETEPGDLQPGTPDGRRFLGGGWSTRDEHGAEGPFVWAVGAASQIRLPILEPRPLYLEIRCIPFLFPGAPAQDLTVLLGEEIVAQQELHPGLHDYRFLLPAELQEEGINELALRWGWHRSPAEVSGAADRRSLAAAVYGLRLTGGNGDPPVAREQRLWLPWGSRVDFFLDLPSEAILQTGERNVRGHGELSLSIVTDDGEISRRILRPDSDRAVALPPGRQRLRFLARSTGGHDISARVGEGSRGGGIMLAAPRVLMPEEVGPEEVGPDESATAAAPHRGPGAAAPPSILLYSIDTLRADRLALYGGPIPTPELEAFAAEALVFDRASAQSSWTKASMASALTGLWPPAHGAINRRNTLAPERLTIQELLSAAGYETAAFITNPNLTAVFGFDQGFDHFEEIPESTDADGVHHRVDTWLTARGDSTKPLFLWVHTLDPHAPYAPPTAARQRWAPEVSPDVAANSQRLLDDLRSGRLAMDPALLGDLLRLYDAEAAFADRAFGQFLGTLESHGLGEAAILVLSDHGEEFLEHGNLEHGRALYGESVHVPFILRLPGPPDARRAARLDAPAQHLDVLPTLCCLAGLQPPGQLEGRCLVDAFAMPPAAVASHLHLDGAERVAITVGELKLLAERGRDGRLAHWRLHDLAEDPGEKTDLSAQRPVDRGWLGTELRRRLAGRRDAVEIELDPEMRARLEALGYL